MDLRKNYTIDAEAAINGDWIRGLTGYGNFGVKIASLDAPSALVFQRRLSKRILGRRRTRHDGDVPPEVLDYIIARSLIEIVSDWENWEDDGAPYPYSRENLAAMLLEDAPNGKIEASDGKFYDAPVEPEAHLSRKRFRFEMRDLMYEVFVLAADKVKAIESEAEASAKKQSSTGRDGKPAASRSSGTASP